MIHYFFYSSINIDCVQLKRNKEPKPRFGFTYYYADKCYLCVWIKTSAPSY